MKARLTTSFAGPNAYLKRGSIVEGEDAKSFVEAGFAVPIIEQAVSKKETATRSVKKETR